MLANANSFHKTVVIFLACCGLSAQAHEFAGGTGRTTTRMQTAAAFVNAGWDFGGIWMICEGRDYPHLQWEKIECAQR